MNSQITAVKSETFSTSDSGSDAVPAADSTLFVAYFSVCSVCGEQFLLQDDLHKHMVTHSVTHPVSCRKCLFRCRTGGELAEHIKKEHTTQLKRRKESFNQVDRRLRCAKCGIDSFPGYSWFKNHHIFHLVTQPEPRVLLERLDRALVHFGIAAALASTEETSSSATPGAAASIKLKLRRDSRSSVEPSDQFKVVMADTGSDSGVDVQADLLCEKPTNVDDAGALYIDTDIEQLAMGSAECVSFDSEQNGSGQLLVDTDLDINGLPIELQALDDSEHVEAGIVDSDADFDALLQSSASATVDGVVDEECGEAGGGEEEDCGEQQDSSDEAAPSDESRALPPPPSLLPVSCLAGMEEETAARESNSAPPPSSLSSPVDSTAVVRSASSEPSDGCSSVPANEDGSTQESAPDRTNESTDPEAVKSGTDDQPVIRMAAIAANIPDERSFRQEVVVSTTSITSGQHLPPQLQQRPPPMLSLAATHLNSPAATASGSMPPLRPAVGSLAGPTFTGATPNLSPAVSNHSVACFVCRVALPTVRALQEHLVTAHSSLQCTMCMFKASSVNELRAHCLSLHGSANSAAPQRGPVTSGVFVPPRLGVMGATTSVMANGSMHPMQQQHRMAVMGPGIRRGRPPLRSRIVDGPMMLSAAASGPRPMQMGRPVVAGGQQAGVRAAYKAGQKRPVGNPVVGVSGLGGDSPVKRRPNIPIQPDKSDCQVISVQRRQQGMPRIQNVEGNAGGAVATSNSSRNTDGSPQLPGRTSGQSDVTSVLANRGISVTPANGTTSSQAASRGASVSLPTLPAGISLTPANTSTAASPASPASSNSSFAVPAVPPRRDSGVLRPSRPPTVDLTVDNPVRPASLACHYCPRQFTTNLALQQHEKSHATSTNPPAAGATGSPQLRCRICGVTTAGGVSQMQQHVLKRHPGVPMESAVAQIAPSGGGSGAGGRAPDLVVPVFDLAMVSRDQLEELGVRGFLPVSQVNQRQGQLGLPIISLDGLGKSGPSPRPAGFFNLGPMRLLR